MTKAVSVTLKADNVLWLRAQASATARGSLSEVLDRIVSDARQAGRTQQGSVRSVVGTIDLADDDPDLARADEFVRAQFAQSLRRPMLVKERTAAFRARTKRR